MEWLNEYNFVDERNEFIARSTITETINKIYLQLEERKKSLKTYLLDQFIVRKKLTL